MSENVDNRQRRLGIIVLVFCVIVGLFVILPAIHSDRDRGRHRTECVNNLKQLVLATTNFETGKKRLPGIQSIFGVTQDRAKLGSWVVSLLPFIEEQTLRDLWDSPSNQDQWEVAWLRSSSSSDSEFYPSLPALNCPKVNQPSGQHALTSYLANAGFYLLPNDPALGLSAYKDVDDESQRSTISQRSANGVFANQLAATVYDPRNKQIQPVFGVAQAIKSSEIRDGASSTIAFVESSNVRSWKTVSITDDSVRYHLGVLWLYAGEKASADRPEPRPLSTQIMSGGSPVDSKLSPLSAWPSSNHPGVYNVGMVDGSVRTMSIHIDYLVYQSLLAPRNQDSDIPNLSYALKATDY